MLVEKGLELVVGVIVCVVGQEGLVVDMNESHAGFGDSADNELTSLVGSVRSRLAVDGFEYRLLHRKEEKSNEKVNSLVNVQAASFD